MRKQTLHVSEIIVPIEVKKLSTGDYLATSRVLRGLIAQGRTITETLEIAQDVAKKLIESYQAHQDPLPYLLRKQIKQKTKTTHLQVPVAVNF